MSGFDNGTLQGGIYFQAKQFGSVLRGFGPPVPQAGIVGDLYLDVNLSELYSKRSNDAGGDVDPWGHYMFIVPLAYRTTLKWFSTAAPSDDIGVAGDYCMLWGGYQNYGMQPSLYGPKTATGWPENGNGPDLTIAVAGAGQVLPVGLLDEGAAVNDSSSTQLIVVGLSDEYVLGLPVLAAAGDLVTQAGLQSGPAQISVAINPLYTAEDTHDIGIPPVGARLPAAAPSITVLTSDVELGINTSVAPTVCALPSVAGWVAENVGGYDLAIFDFTGQAPTNNITFTLDGTDVFTQGISPVILNAYGELRLRPIITGTGINQWYIKGIG